MQVAVAPNLDLSFTEPVAVLKPVQRARILATCGGECIPNRARYRVADGVGEHRER